jgi:hypothetical protein
MSYRTHCKIDKLLKEKGTDRQFLSDRAKEVAPTGNESENTVVKRGKQGRETRSQTHTTCDRKQFVSYTFNLNEIKPYSRRAENVSRLGCFPWEQIKRPTIPPPKRRRDSVYGQNDGYRTLYQPARVRCACGGGARGLQSGHLSTRPRRTLWTRGEEHFA